MHRLIDALRHRSQPILKKKERGVLVTRYDFFGHQSGFIRRWRSSRGGRRGPQRFGGRPFQRRNANFTAALHHQVSLVLALGGYRARSFELTRQQVAHTDADW